MFCPQCGANQSGELKFCKVCGANLHVVRQALATTKTGGKFDPSKSRVSDTVLREGERERREAEVVRRRGVTPEVKRRKEIKAGVITSSVGVGVSIFLWVLMQGVISGGSGAPGDSEILRRIWVAGAIPFCLGIGLIINGLFLSKSHGHAVRRDPRTGPDALQKEPEHLSLWPADTTEFIPSPFSVTDEPTRLLRDSGQKR